ncbi:uncharacterized protein EDB91DRAFT_1167905 [Suillus paluster]|uniref:uncharacterized protein n=1 Tax=Suillus paluster TaxID=48578 RepID=UPI001B86289D|nr:uncharacterized protein EDB91DRAFT_1167905 [Suillus paluster]KAG1725550.1 hypothetical protein EDB91DRAFT_1167905 [Suillus paluster]
MEEFTSTLEAISLYINIPASSLSPALPVVQQFKSLPDFLMFPAFLALKNQDHYTSALLQDRLPTDMEIINAMIAFVEFGNQAWERSHSAPDALKYASQNWAFHLSLAPNPQDDMLHRTFQSFWSRHLLTWLERQWCLKGLQSCLVVLSEGQKLAKVPVKSTFDLNTTS